jgi:hypothetical protein
MSARARNPLAGSRARPSCGHVRPSECPLTFEDWRAIWMAYLGFLSTCRFICEQAHARDPEGGDK